MNTISGKSPTSISPKEAAYIIGKTRQLIFLKIRDKSFKAFQANEGTGYNPEWHIDLVSFVEWVEKRLKKNDEVKLRLERCIKIKEAGK